MERGGSPRADRAWGASHETFFWDFKQGLNAASWLVFSSWEAIDHLLAAAHIAFLALSMIADFARRGRTAAFQEIWDWMQNVLRTRFARPPEMTLGRAMLLIAMDFPSPRWAEVNA